MGRTSYIFQNPSEAIQWEPDSYSAMTLPIKSSQMKQSENFPESRLPYSYPNKNFISSIHAILPTTCKFFFSLLCSDLVCFKYLGRFINNSTITSKLKSPGWNQEMNFQHANIFFLLKHTNNLLCEPFETKSVQKKWKKTKKYYRSIFKPTILHVFAKSPTYRLCQKNNIHPSSHFHITHITLLAHITSSRLVTCVCYSNS